MSQKKHYYQSHSHTTLSPPSDIKPRLISCLNRLSDRDTASLATAELHSIAQTLTPDTFSLFLNCIHSTDSSTKSPVRKQCVSALSFLSLSHRDALSPHVPKMVSIIIRRLRDPDSAVRSACVDAVAAIRKEVESSPLSAVVTPLVEAMSTEQDANVQIGAAMCVTAAVESAGVEKGEDVEEEEVEVLRKVVVRVRKLLRSEGFRAKAAALVVIGSVVGVGGVVSRGVLDGLVKSLVEFLGSEGWAARKAAAEALGKVAVAEAKLAVEHKVDVLNCLERRRFDKVKIVRETMNRTLEQWKEVPDFTEGVLASPQLTSSPSGNGATGCFPSLTRSSNNSNRVTADPAKPVPKRRSLPSCTASETISPKEVPRKSTEMPPTGSNSKPGQKKSTDWKVEISVLHASSMKLAQEHDVQSSNEGVSDSQKNGNGENVSSGIRRALFHGTQDERKHRFGGFKSVSRVVPFNEFESFDLSVNDGATEEVYESQKEMEDLSLIQKQLAQIEFQQSSLLNLLQKFMGRSQSGINSLETRVHGLEMALEEISYDLGYCGGRLANIDSGESTCCKLPGADFLSSKFWKKGEGRFSTSRLSSSGTLSPLPFSALCNMPDRDAGLVRHQLSNEGLQN